MLVDRKFNYRERTQHDHCLSANVKLIHSHVRGHTHTSVKRHDNLLVGSVLR